MLRIARYLLICGISRYVKHRYVILINFYGQCSILDKKYGEPRQFYVQFKRDVRRRGKRHMFRVGYQNLFHKNDLIEELCTDDSYVTWQREQQYRRYILHYYRRQDRELNRMF